VQNADGGAEMEGGDGADGSAGGGQGGGLTYIKRGAGAEAWEGGGECAKYKSGMGGGGGGAIFL
jgi:hypothetical protein